MIQTHRKAFSMLTAIFTIVLMSTVAAYIMNLSGKIIKETTTQFQKEQAALYAKSYTEYAIMAVMANDRNGAGNDCIDTINGIVSNNTANAADDYNVTVNISYIGLATTIINCTNQLGNPAGNDELNIIVDTYVQYNDIDTPGLPPITYHRRTLQKI